MRTATPNIRATKAHLEANAAAMTAGVDRVHRGGMLGQEIPRPGQRQRRRFVAGQKERHRFVAHLQVRQAPAAIGLIVLCRDEHRQQIAAIRVVRAALGSVELQNPESNEQVRRPASSLVLFDSDGTALWKNPLKQRR